MDGEDYAEKNRQVEEALFMAATGHTVKLKTPLKIKEETNRPGEGKQVFERVVTRTEEKYVEPKITAAMFWLKCRMPEKWGSGDRALEETQREMTPVLETYADMLENPVPERSLEEMDDADQLFPAE
ncbi:MAG: hypothetical protein IJ157_14160 [Clostridia bacterium]|nr:hypothetical protein [Clostridia bacterium]